MFGFLKRRLVAKVEDWERREIARLQQKSRRLKEELERKTGKPVQLTSEQRALLAEKAKGIDPEILKQISEYLGLMIPVLFMKPMDLNPRPTRILCFITLCPRSNTALLLCRYLQNYVL